MAFAQGYLLLLFFPARPPKKKKFGGDTPHPGRRLRPLHSRFWREVNSPGICGCHSNFCQLSHSGGAAPLLHARMDQSGASDPSGRVRQAGQGAAVRAAPQTLPGVQQRSSASAVAQWLSLLRGFECQKRISICVEEIIMSQRLAVDLLELL